jgi:hypothetical protein
MAQASAPAANPLADLAIVIPVLNRRCELDATLQELPRAGEVIVVDGGSSDDRAWQARLIELGVRLRVALLALPYGDQALLIHRSLYKEAGGYCDLPLMEDVDLVRRLGRRRLARLDGTATTSAERWRRRGWARQSLANLRCLILYMSGAPIERIVRARGR